MGKIKTYDLFKRYGIYSLLATHIKYKYLPNSWMYYVRKNGKITTYSMKKVDM